MVFISDTSPKMPPITTHQKQHNLPSSTSHHHPTTTNTKPMKQGLIPTFPAAPEREWGQEIRPRKPVLLLRPRRRTNPLVWCGAALCVIFSLVLILAGVLTLILFLVIKPRYPSFDTTAASLNGVYLDAPTYFNGDFMFLANFSNPNSKIDILFEYMGIELYFYNRPIATQGLQSFAQRSGEKRVVAIHMVSSLVYLPPGLAVELQKQVRSNRVEFTIKGTFRVKASLGFVHLSYWLYVRCLVELTGPPRGVLMARSCRTKR